MRFWIFLAFVLIFPASAFSAKRLTVEELKQLVASLHQEGKSDQEFAASLQKVQLSEELTPAAAAALAAQVPGNLALDQVMVLGGLSVFEPPSATLTAQPSAPDSAAQSAILQRAGGWVSLSFDQAPAFTAEKVVQRFQQNTQSTNAPPDVQSDTPTNYGRGVPKRTDKVEIVRGVEKPAVVEAPVKWGENGQMSEGSPFLALPALFQEVNSAGKPTFLRWELVDGKSAAVFTFTVDKRRSHYTVDYCCFVAGENVNPSEAPNTDAVNLPALGTVHHDTWRPFRKGAPYHGFIYIDPDSGAIMRTVTVAELKPYDWVHAEKVRIDYGIENLGGKSCAVPVRKVMWNEVVPGSDTRQFSYPVRREVYTADYANYAAH